MKKKIEIAEAVQRFGTLAERYCAVLERATTLERNAFLRQLYVLLPELIAEAIRLPRVRYSDDEAENPEEEARNRALEAKAQISHESSRELCKSLKAKFGDWDNYWMVFDPTEDSEAIHGSLADDIGDIYRDLKEGVLLAGMKDYPARDVIFEWRLGFDTHWGKHAIDALRTIHTFSAQILA